MEKVYRPLAAKSCEWLRDIIQGEKQVEIQIERQESLKFEDRLAC